MCTVLKNTYFCTCANVLPLLNLFFSLIIQFLFQVFLSSVLFGFFDLFVLFLFSIIFSRFISLVIFVFLSILSCFSLFSIFSFQCRFSSPNFLCPLFIFFSSRIFLRLLITLIAWLLVLFDSFPLLIIPFTTIFSSLLYAVLLGLFSISSFLELSVLFLLVPSSFFGCCVARASPKSDIAEFGNLKKRTALDQDNYHNY